jgi:hypothetical protein
VKNIRGLVVASVLAAALAGCGGSDDPPVAADDADAEEPTTTTAPEDDDEASALPAASGDLDALAEAVRATLGRSDVGVAGASLGLFPEWLPAADDAAVFESAVWIEPPIGAGVARDGGDAPVLNSRVKVQYLTAEDADTLQPRYDEALAAEGWQPAAGGWRSSEDDRARVARAEFHTAEGYDGPAIEVTVVALADEPDRRRVELEQRADLTADEVAATPELGNSLSLIQDDVPVPDGFTLSGGTMSINPFGASVSVETSWMIRESLDHATLAGEVADGLPAGGWSVAGEAEATAESITTVPVARAGWERGRLVVSSSPDLDSAMVTVTAERPLDAPAPGGSPAPAPAPESGGAAATA